MITVLHGGQTGVDRGAHEAAIDNGWLVAGYMPREARDERGLIPEEVARFLQRHEKAGYGPRTDANVRACDALLVIVQDERDPRSTPGTAKTIDLATSLYKRRQIVDPRHSPKKIAEWIWRDLLALRTLPLPLEARTFDPVPTRLMVAGPRVSKWKDAQAETAIFLRRVGYELRVINAAPSARRTG